jgi:poly(3-hydroxybutyrate) depolymerase
MLDRWIAHDGCAPEPEVGAPLRGAPGTEDEGHTATRLVWRPCREGAEVVHWRLTGAGHGWPGGRTDRAGAERLVGPRTTIVDAAEEAWDFFARFSLPN